MLFWATSCMGITAFKLHMFVGCHMHLQYPRMRLAPQGFVKLYWNNYWQRICHRSLFFSWEGFAGFVAVQRNLTFKLRGKKKIRNWTSRYRRPDHISQEYFGLLFHPAQTPDPYCATSPMPSKLSCQLFDTWSWFSQLLLTSASTQILKMIESNMYAWPRYP